MLIFYLSHLLVPREENILVLHIQSVEAVVGYLAQGRLSSLPAPLLRPFQLINYRMSLNMSLGKHIVASLSKSPSFVIHFRI